MVYDGPINHKGRTEFTAWLKIDGAYPGLPILKYEEYRPDGSLVTTYQDGVMFSTVVWRNWIRPYYLFQVENPGNRVVIYFDECQSEVESVLIRPENVDVFLPKEGEGLRMFNNYYFEE